MSRYNEDERQRIKDAERNRQKSTYRRKLLLDTQEDDWRKEVNLRDNDFNHIKEIKIKNDTHTSLIIIITICILLVMGSGFLFTGLYENFFYEKIKGDLIEVTDRLSKTEKPVNTGLRQHKSVSQEIVKKWKRTIWEVRKGQICNKKSCNYIIEQFWTDCYRPTGKCNKTKSKKLNRNNNHLRETRTIYL